MKDKLELFFLYFFFKTISSVISNTIFANQTLSGNQTIVSSGGNFDLGFFTPGNSSSYYLGIWYNKIRIPIQTVVWVANRETPISDINSAQLRILNGNLVLLDNSQIPALIWSTDLIFSKSSNSVVAILLDDGNLILRDGSMSNSNLNQSLWESFNNLGDTWLPGAKVSFNKHTRTNRPFISWRNIEDPAPGLFSLELEVNSTIQFLISWNRTERYWTSGAWNGQFFSRVPQLRSNSFYRFSYADNENESYFTYSLYNPSSVSRFVVDVSGLVKMLTWSDNSKEWILYGTQPRQQCEAYACCGAFGTCNQDSSQFCSCLPGFRHKSERDWNLGDYSGGCVDEVNLQCVYNETNYDPRTRFLMNSVLRLPDEPHITRVRNSSECEASCLRNCSCRAYSYNSDRCSIWNDKLLNMQQLNKGDTNGSMIYVKLAASSSVFLSSKNNKGAIIAAIVVSAAIVLAIILVVILWRTRRKKAKRNGKQEIEEDYLLLFLDQSGGSAKGIDVRFYNLDSILLATNNFSNENKLGQGGFGPVYKGRFPSGNEIAVKRLSSTSSQGISEFRNEVILIAKLQHRNLVRLLGYCLDQNEKILLYEYMPNKSLDAFLFDQKKCLLLDGKKRFNIILGVARGLVYLHQDSRLRIIHRDLKTSNILLDEEMNPKISDFGLARIVEGKRTEENTNKIVGTYGYMSPEYAMEGKFSIKSDVFSFGVVVLEIISGKKNTGFYQPDEVLNLLGYAWNSWCQNEVMDLADPTVQQSWDESLVFKCINVGLLCVQEDPNDRPTMSSVVMMLSSDKTTLLPRPTRPAFVLRKHVGSGFPTKPVQVSRNEFTISEAVGR